MLAKLVAAITENSQFIEFATGNLTFGVSVLALLTVGAWVLYKRMRNHKL